MELMEEQMRAMDEEEAEYRTPMPPPAASFVDPKMELPTVWGGEQSEAGLTFIGTAPCAPVPATCSRAMASRNVGLLRFGPPEERTAGGIVGWPGGSATNPQAQHPQRVASRDGFGSD